MNHSENNQRTDNFDRPEQLLPLAEQAIELATKAGAQFVDATCSESRDVDVTIDSVHLGPGQYYINANAAGVSEPSSHGIMQAVLLTVTGQSTTFGAVSAQISVSESASD